MFQVYLSVCLLLAAVAAVGYFRFFVKKRVRLPPGPRGRPIFGNIFDMMADPKNQFCKWQAELGKIFTIKFGHINAVMLGDVNLVRECFKEPVFSGRFDRLMISILSKGRNGILITEGNHWMEQRRFTLRHLRDFGFGKDYMETLIMDEVRDFILWLKHEEGLPVTLQHKFELAVVNALWFIVTGRKFEHNDKQLLDLLKEMDEHFTKTTLTARVRMLAPFLLKLAPSLLGLTQAEEAANRLHNFLLQVIKEHQDTLPPLGHARDFIDAYLHEIQETKDENSSFCENAGFSSLLAVIGDLFFAGAETTSTTLLWAILYLAVNSNVQVKLQEELDSVIGRTRQVSLKDRTNLPYVVATIEEILRKSSIVAIGMMHIATEDSTFVGYDIPKGTWIMPNIYAIHHSPEIWGDPQNFRPERFLEEVPKSKSQSKSKSAAPGTKIEENRAKLRFKKNENLLPFSLGKRSCLGESFARDQIFLFLTNIFQRFSVHPDPTRPTCSCEAKKGLFLRTQDYYVVMKDRLA